MRTGLLDAARRAYLGLTRGTVVAANDSPKMQTLDVRGYQNELLSGVERLQHYGSSSIPLPPDQDGKAAEVVMGFVEGNRSHALVIMVDDRRHRPTGGESGQVGHYHYQGATATFLQKGFVQDAGPMKKPHVTKVGSTTVQKEDGKITTDTGTKLFTGVVHLGVGGSLAT